MSGIGSSTHSRKTTESSVEHDLDLLESSALALQHLVRHEGIPVERLDATRAITQVSKQVTGEGVEIWYARLIEAGKAFDLRVRSVQCSLDQLSGMIDTGVMIATLTGSEFGPQGWLIIEGRRRRSFRVANPRTGRTENLSLSGLQKRLGITATNQPLQWIVCQSPLVTRESTLERMGWLTSEGEKHLSPWQRLWAMVASERQDIWVLFVFSLVVGLLTLTTPIAVESLVDMVSFGRLMQPVIILALIVFTLLGFSATLTALMMYVMEILQRRLFVRVVEDFAFRIPRASQTALDEHYAPELMNRYFDVMIIQKTLPKILLDGLAVIMQMLIGMIVLAFYHPYLLGFDIVLLTLFSVMLFVVGRGAVNTAIKESKIKYYTAAWLEDIARSPSAFRANNGEGYAMEQADQLATEYLDYRQKHFRIYMRQVIFSLGIYVIAVTSLLGLGGWLVMSGELSLGQLVASELIVMVIVSSIVKLGQQMEGIYDLAASADKLGHVFDLPLAEDGKIILPAMPGTAAEVSVRGVDLTVHDHAVFQGLNWDVRPGTAVAVYGPAASGKSVLAEMLTGARRPQAGVVLLDGVDIRELRHDWVQNQVGVVGGIEPFAAPLENNVHLNRPHIDAQQVLTALDYVGLLEPVEALPDGVRTELQSNGRPLSSQQLACLMLARGVVNQPRLLLIDGTLDVLPTDQVRGIIERLRASLPCTIVLMTGRQELAAICDQVLDLGAQ